MWCFQAKRWISAYLDDELDRDRLAALEEHLERCHSCSTELDRLRSQSSALRAVDEAPLLPRELWSLIEGELDAAEQLPWYRRRPEFLIRAVAVAACVLVGFAGGALLSWRSATAHGDQPRPPMSEEGLFAEAFDAPVFTLGGEEEEWSRCDPK